MVKLRKLFSNLGTSGHDVASPFVARDSSSGSFAPKIVEAFLKLAFKEATVPPFAVRKELWFNWCEDALEEGDVDRLQFLIMTSALIGRHEDSGFNRLEYLANVIRLYNDPAVDDKKMEGIFIKDIVEGSLGNITYDELQSALAHAENAPAQEEAKSVMRTEFCPWNEKDQQTYSAIPKEQLLPMLRWLCKEDIITFEQVALVLCVNLHSRERRNSGGRYLDHPMAVAGAVLDVGQHFFDNEHDLSVALVSALMHDTGEKSNYIPEKDYADLMPEEVVYAIDTLHKKRGQTYFKYVQLCGKNRHTAIVKWQDPIHNCADATAEKASFKQKYIYPIVAAYEKACFFDSSVSRLSLREFCLKNSIYDGASFDILERVSNSKKGEYNSQQIEDIEKDIKLDTLALANFVVFNHLPLPAKNTVVPLAPDAELL